MKRIDKRVDLQVSILLAVFVAVAMMTCFAVSYRTTYNDMKYSLRERVGYIYTYLSGQLDMSAFADFEFRDDIESAEYIMMHDVFSAVKDATGVMYLYTAKKNADGKYIYVVDGLDWNSEDFRYPGDLIEEEIYGDMDRALGGEEVYPDEILHTSWGDIFICYLPLYDEGRVTGVLGIEFKAEHQYQTYRKLELFVPCAVIVFTIVAFITSWKLFGRINKIVVKETEQRKALADALYKAEVANKAKSSFLFNISHDIRTPMNVIIGFTQIARENLNDLERAKDSLDKVARASQHLKRILNDLLDMARIEKGNLELEIAPMDIRESAEETEQMFRPQMEEKGLVFEVILKDIFDNRVMCDSLRIKQIAMNLLSNALKYTEEGGRVIYEVSQLPCKDPGYTQIEMRVKDTGVGMTEEFKKHIFGIFEREKSATESGVEGAGLGLAITSQLVRLYNGSIEVNSQKGEGTEVIVRIKLEIAREEPVIQEERISFNGMRVLVVEDNPLNKEIAEVMLSEEGFLVECAEDGEEAVRKISESEPGYYDIVLMDIQMPHMNGYEAAREIRRLRNPGLARIPIVALTANAQESDKRNAFDSGMNAHVAKPIDMTVLNDTLKEILA